ncbi:MAG: VC0807 family protein, partial [Desulfobacterales bacterium]
QTTSAPLQISGATFPYRQFILGALVPISLFYVFHRLEQPLAGALLAIGWSISLLGFTYWRSRRIELFPGLAIPIIAIELIGTLITRDPAFYLASAAIENALWGLVFLGSILISRPLIQVFAELLNPGLGSQEFLEQLELSPQLYRSAWQIITAAWGIVALSKAMILVFSQLWLPIETFLIIRTASGIPVMVLMLFLSYRFPEWYWKWAMERTRLKAESSKDKGKRSRARAER